AGSAVEVERRGGLHDGGRYQRPEHDPRAVAPGDEHRVLPVEADARPGGRLAVDVLVGVDEDAVLAAEPASQLVQALAEHGVAVVPGVTRQSPLSLFDRGLRRVVAVGRRHDSSRTFEQCLRMTRDVRLRHRDAHIGEETAGLSLADVPLRLFVRRCTRWSDVCELLLLGVPYKLGLGQLYDSA